MLLWMSERSWYTLTADFPHQVRIQKWQQEQQSQLGLRWPGLCSFQEALIVVVYSQVQTIKRLAVFLQETLGR